MMNEPYDFGQQEPPETSPAASDQRHRGLREELRELAGVVGPARLVDLLVERAFELNATDIHLDPTDEGLRVRLRVDGLLHDLLPLPAEITSNVVSRIKLVAGMDITERRLAQDGHIASTSFRHERDVRVGSGPTIHGERLVLRLMPDAQMLTRLEDLGLEDDQLQQVRRLVSVPYGMILCVGPVGAGKSTTIYSCLELLNDPDKSLVTIEDPVERRIEGANQVQVDPRIDFGFVEALRGVLRQDPNVMMVGEIRDPETARIACRAGLTGITVLTTLHAGDAAATVDVFRQFEVPPMFIADSLQCVISQRLLRKVCPECRTTYRPDAAACQFLGVDPAQANGVELARGTGCEACFQTGYRGRTGVFEIMGVQGDVAEAILRGGSRHELAEVARAQGMQTLEAAARRKVLSGVTTLEEVHRVLTAFPA